MSEKKITKAEYDKAVMEVMTQEVNDPNLKGAGKFLIPMVGMFSQRKFLLSCSVAKMKIRRITAMANIYESMNVRQKLARSPPVLPEPEGQEVWQEYAP